MNLEYFSRLWIEGKPTKASSKSFWNNRADEFNKTALQGGTDERINRIVKHLRHNNLLLEDSNVLDIGCGPGKFAVEFARKSAEVIGIDISDKMLDYAIRNTVTANLSNVTFKNLDWDKINLEKLGWSKKFDLVTAINSPGVHDLLTLEKMINASKGYCFLSNFVDRHDSVQDIIRRDILNIKDVRFFSNTMYCIFNILWLTGYYPIITYIDTDREQIRTVAEACNYYGTLFDCENDSSGKKETLIKNYLKEIASNGLVKERVQTKTAWIYWKV